MIKAIIFDLNGVIICDEDCHECPCRDVLDFIDFVHRRYKLAITTGAIKQQVDRILKEFKLREKFAVVVSVDDVETSKPDPGPYLFTAKQLAIAPAECLVIEDTPAGIKAAKAAGMKCVAITTTNPVTRLDQADFIVDNFSEIKNIL